MTYSRFFVSVLLCMAAAGVSAQPAAEKNVTVTYIGNEGFLLQGGGTKILIDAPYTSGYDVYVTPSEETVRKLTGGSAPFNDIDICMMTHHHGDHFDPAYTQSLMSAVPEMQLMGPKTVIDMMKSRDGSTAFVSRFVETTPDLNKRIDVQVNGTDVRVLRLRHDSGTEMNVGYLFTLNGLRILHMGDFMGMVMSDLDAFDLPKEKIDVAFVNFYAYADGGERMLREVIKRTGAAHIVLMHVEVGRERKIAEAVRTIFPDSTVFEHSMDSLIFRRTAKGVSADKAPIR